MEKPTVKSASEILLSALQRTPMSDWENVIFMAMNSIHETGYAAGYRNANNIGGQEIPGLSAQTVNTLNEIRRSNLDIKGNGLPEAAAIPALGEYEGEDRTLSKDKGSDQDDADEALGNEFLSRFAILIGRQARFYDVTPGGADLDIMSHILPGGETKSIRLFLELRNPTLKG